MKNPITQMMIVEAYNGFQRDINNGDGLFCRKPYQRLMKRSKMPKNLCIEACEAAIRAGLINAPDAVECSSLFSLARTDTLLTAKGKRLLGLPKEVNSEKPEGPDLLVDGWKWK